MSAAAPGPRYTRKRTEVTCYLGVTMHMVGYILENAFDGPRHAREALAKMITPGLHAPPDKVFNKVLIDSGDADLAAEVYKGEQDDVGAAFATFVAAYAKLGEKKGEPDYAGLARDCTTIYDITVTCDAAGHTPKPPRADGEKAASAAEAVPVRHTEHSVLTLPLMPGVAFTVGSGLDKFFETEKLDFKCEEEGCASAKSTRGYTLLNVPDFLVLNVNRSLYFDGKSDAVVIPESVIEFGGFDYTPAIIVLHHGDSGVSGHYTALRRSVGDDGEYVWWHYDDAHASKIEGGFTELQADRELMAAATVFLYHREDDLDGPPT